ncbi:hypothetical protein F2Q70_00006859 [Brassica cretica]|uniref:Uncharacterized protein n=1 Tax=Brassica cretica TaxID=69181 RepID=A0A8S9FN87_BRACR|nr:hypothetical protein F2Q68_00023530 [Brassica cretica]KAF2575751.1 hypothetical protein F2Q70_00006859 [Brassica cretica]
MAFHRTSPETERRFTEPHREQLLTQTHHFITFASFHWRASNEKSRPHPETKPSPKRLEIPHSPFMHHHHLISDHQRVSIEQIEISSVTSSTKSTESPLEKLEKSKHNRHKMQKESPSPENKAGEACLKSNDFPEAKTQRKRIKEPIEYQRKLHLIS